jgi:hypothetical protein
VQAAEQLEQLRVQGADVRLERGLLADLDDVVLDLRARLVVRLLDPRRVDAPVGQQLLERQPCDLAAHAVEAGQDDRAGRVVDDEVDAGEHLEGADVAPLAADDSALQVVGLERDDRHRRLRRVAAGQPLHARRQDAAGAPVGVAARLLLDLADELRAVVAQLALELAQEQLPGLARRQVRDPLELAQVLLLGLLQPLGLDLQVAGAVLERGLAPLELVGAGVDRLLLGEQALLDARDLRPSLAQLGLQAG